MDSSAMRPNLRQTAIRAVAKRDRDNEAHGKELTRDFLEALKRGDTQKCINLFEQAPTIVGGDSWPWVLRCRKKISHMVGNPANAISLFDNHRVLRHILSHPLQPLRDMRCLASYLCHRNAVRSLEVMLRLGAMDTEWTPITIEQVEKVTYMGDQTATIAARMCMTRKHPAAFALILRWGGPMHRRGLESGTGCTWMYVAWMFARDTFYEEKNHFMYRAASLVKEKGAGPREVLARLFELAPRAALARVAFVDPRRGDRLVRWRRAVEAKRDASMVFKAASEGRPMELAKRLRLGKLAGGAQSRGRVSGAGGALVELDALQAARVGGHGECARLVEEASGTASSSVV